MRSFLLGLSAMAFFSGCGSSGGGSPTPTPTPTPYAHVVGGSATTYTEAQESSNTTSSTPESTGYTLNSTGLSITGAFEAGTPSRDYYSFNAGTAGYVSVRLFVNGAASAADVKIQCSGYTAMPIGSSAASQDKVAVVSGLSCNAIIYPVSAEAGSTYTLELIASP